MAVAVVAHAIFRSIHMISHRRYTFESKQRRPESREGTPYTTLARYASTPPARDDRRPPSPQSLVSSSEWIAASSSFEGSPCGHPTTRPSLSESDGLGITWKWT